MASSEAFKHDLLLIISSMIFLFFSLGLGSSGNDSEDEPIVIG